MLPNLIRKDLSEHNILIVSFALLFTFALCLDSGISAEAPSVILQLQSSELQGTTNNDLSSSTGKVIEIPLQGRFTDDGRFYFLNTSVGTEGQPLELLVDTGSTDTWVYGTRFCNGSFGNDTWKCYNESASSTSKTIPSPPFFNATYGDDKLSGVYMEDVFRMSTMSVRALRFGVIDQGNFTAGGGLLGLGFDTAEFGPNDTYGYLYPDLLDTMFNESIIGSRSFGLSIRNSDVPEVEATGSLMLGGFDTSKMSGPSIEFGIVSPKKMARLGAPLTSISANVNGESTVVWNVTSDDTIRKTYIPAVLDSGASRTEIPILAHRDLIKHLNRSFKGGLFAKREKGSPWLGDMDCGHRSVNVTDFTFAADNKSITIKAPFSELVLPWHYGCRFALWPRPQYTEPFRGPSWVNFGSSVMGSLYMAVNYDTNTIQIAKARHTVRGNAIIDKHGESQDKSEL